MKLIIKEQQESNENEKVCYISKENFENKYLKDKKVIVIIHENMDVLRIAYVI